MVPSAHGTATLSIEHLKVGPLDLHWQGQFNVDAVNDAVTVGIHDVTLGGLVPPLKVTAADHEGGGWVQIFQVHDGKLVKETDWFRGYPEVVAAAVKKAE